MSLSAFDESPRLFSLVSDASGEISLIAFDESPRLFSLVSGASGERSEI